MSQRRANKRKGKADPIIVDNDEEEERKEDKRSRLEPAAAAAAASSSAAAARSAAPAGPFAASVSASLSRPRGGVEDVVCAACHESFECEDGSERLPRTLPCGHPLCSGCIRQSLSLTPGSVLCPHEHGQLKVSVPAGVAAAAVSTVEGWLRLLPCRADLIAAIKNQQTMMTRIGQQGARCSRPGCQAAVTHYCSKCLDLCTDHERSRHTVFSAHKTHTMPIALKAGFLRDQAQSTIAGPAAEIRVRASAQLKQQQLELQSLRDARKKLNQQLQALNGQVKARAKALATQQRTAKLMLAADDETVLEMEAERLDAQPQPIIHPRPVTDSTVLNTLPDSRVAALQTFLGVARSLTNATLLYRATRDGFKAEDWWRMCGGQANQLTLVKVKRNGFVFGAFAPFQWPAGAPTESATIADPTGATFLFSLVNAHGRAVKLRLKAGCSAGEASPGYGPRFGCDLRLMYDGKSADLPDGNWTQPSSFEFDCVTDGGAPIPYDKTLLAEDDGKGFILVDFPAAEIETWQL